ncbi:alpha-1,2-fucosyltransferase [Butyrivibrio sp. MC2013]|uniref:alpha-1,2-fucosyltransferase n=1 Tax=Butyrivibrio sp. MC2013 TaxID=1280686 RepID=UPI0004170199|nr:alpha-1,2-fucosyltransferase [Butyrivibrio sp. MC2013]
MIIIRIAGGLGNQMQEYAMYRKLQKLGKEVKLDLGWFDKSVQEKMLAPRDCELYYFKNVKMDLCTDEEKARFLNRSLASKVIGKLIPASSRIWEESSIYHPEVFDFKDKYLNGFFLSNKYYADILDELADEFVFPEHSDPEGQRANEELMREMESRPSCSVHLRRGDYLTEPQNFALFGNISTDAYYKAAMDYVAEKDPDVHFYIFSNDPDYCKEVYSDKARYTIVTGNSGKDSLLDMQLMTKCKYNICANSTFSFWGARLNRRADKVMIRTFKMRNNQEAIPEELHDLWKGWILIDENGNLR